MDGFMEFCSNILLEAGSRSRHRWTRRAGVGEPNCPGARPGPHPHRQLGLDAGRLSSASWRARHLSTQTPGTYLYGHRPTVLLRLQTPGTGLGPAPAAHPCQCRDSGPRSSIVPEPPSPVLTEHERLCAGVRPHSAGHIDIRPRPTQAPTQHTAPQSRVPTAARGAGRSLWNPGPHPTGDTNVTQVTTPRPRASQTEAMGTSLSATQHEAFLQQEAPATRRLPLPTWTTSPVPWQDTLPLG